MRPELRELYDLVIVGGGPAGAVAAWRAAHGGLNVLVVEKDRSPRARDHIVWLGPAGVNLCQKCGLTRRNVAIGEFLGLRVHSWNLEHTVFVQDRELHGWVCDRAELGQALLGRASQIGAESLVGLEVCDLQIEEDRVALSLEDGVQVAGKVALVADGADSPTAHLAKLPGVAEQRNVSRCAFAQWQADAEPARLDVAIGTGQTRELATIVRGAGSIGVSVVSTADEASLKRQFLAFCRCAQDRGLLPEGVSPDPKFRLRPAGVALEMDTHVGKNCLLIGDAGGFVAAFSHEGVYPAMRSGWIAAETVWRALRAPVVQDELASFSAAWRGQLADYLRMPNTDLGLLMPLMFNNRQMSRRVAQAFLLGQTF